MKLNKGKLSLSFIVFLVAAFLFTFGFGVIAEEHELSKQQFKDLTGDYLSNGTVDGEEIVAGDTLLLDFDEVVQEKPLLIDLEGISVKPVDDDDTVVIEQNWLDSPPLPPAGTAVAPAEDDNIYDYVDASIVILNSGITLDSLKFRPTSPPGGDGPANAIEVDCCFVGAETLRFHNLLMPTSDATGGFINGIKFDGSVAGTLGCGGESGIDYVGNDDYSIDFWDVRIEGSHSQGIKGNGIVFTNNVGDVGNINFEELYVGNVEENSDVMDVNYSGNGILFNNTGTVKNVTLTKSERTSPSVSELPYALESNASNGILINGETVTEVSGLEFNYTRLEGNGGAGIFVKGELEADPTDPISSLGMTVKNTLIKDNNYGILVASKDASYNLDSQGYSPVQVDGVHLGENLTVHDNEYGGALFKVQVVNGTKSSPALTVSDSQFHRSESDDDSDVNTQDFGLRVDAYEGIFGVEVSGSTFRYHGNTLSGAGIEFLTPIESSADPGDDYFDQIEGITIENTSSQYNVGSGLNIAANVVEDVDILSSNSEKAKFSGNGTADVSSGRSGISIYGSDRVTDLVVTGEADGGEILANYNNEYGMLVGSKEEIYGVEVANAQFGDEVNDNGNGVSGVMLATFGSGTDNHIGSDESEGAISFDNVEASGNDAHGIAVDAAGNFANPSDTIFVNDSEFWKNQWNGLYLYAAKDIKRPRVELSTFVGNNITGGTAGIFIEAGGDEIVGTGNGDIVGNVVAENEIGIAVTDPDIVDDYNYVDTIIDFSVRGNTTVHPDDSDKNGNRWANVVLAAENLNTVSVEDNHLVSAYTDDEEEPNTDYGLWLEANDSSASLSVNQNRFDSGAEGFCVGIGTAILLDAKKTTVKLNEIDGFKTAIRVLQESSDSSEADDTSNHINRNNILGCCTLMDASALDYGNGEKVDATDNYWGEGITKSDLKPNLKSDSSDPFDQIFVEPMRDQPVEVTDTELEINISITPEGPDVNETVELEYELVNNTGTIMNLDEVLLTVTDADEEYIEQDKVLETDVSIPGNDSKTFTYEFTTTDAKGDYTAEITADDYTPKSKTFEVGVIEPVDKEPFWGDSANAAESGILPAPINSANDETPFLDLGNEKDDSVLGYVTINAVNVFDRTGKRLLKIESDFQDMTELESLNNDLYCYTVDYTLDDGTKKTSPVMKFVVDNE